MTVPIRGNGRCPKPESKIRHGLKQCNEHVCTGDEVRIAYLDPILANDSSGSLKAEGWDVIKKLSTKLTGKYMAGTSASRT